jgi:hypothetical protein
MNTATLEQPSVRARITPNIPVTDLTRGAVRFGIRNQKVLLDSSVLEDYSEADPNLGLNATGMVLTVLGQHVALSPGGGRDETIMVALHRRDDGRQVEVELSLSRTRRQGQECLQLTHLGDREVE